MQVFTHLAAGALCGLGYAHLAGASPGMALAGGVAGALLPDIDHPQSWLGRRLPFVSIPLALLIGHRGVTHSALALFLALLGALAFASLSGASGGLAAAFAGAICAGYASHLAIDWLTPAGIPFLWPKLTRYRSPRLVIIGGAGELLLAAVMWFGVALLGWPA